MAELAKQLPGFLRQGEPPHPAFIVLQQPELRLGAEKGQEAEGAVRGQPGTVPTHHLVQAKERRVSSQ